MLIVGHGADLSALDDELQQPLLYHLAGFLRVICGGAHPDHRVDVGAEALVREFCGEVVRHQPAVRALGPVGGKGRHDSIGVELEDGEREPEVVEVSALLALVQRAELRGDEPLRAGISGCLRRGSPPGCLDGGASPGVSVKAKLNTVPWGQISVLVPGHSPCSKALAIWSSISSVSSISLLVTILMTITYLLDLVSVRVFVDGGVIVHGRTKDLSLLAQRPNRHYVDTLFCFTGIVAKPHENGYELRWPGLCLGVLARPPAWRIRTREGRACRDSQTSTRIGPPAPEDHRCRSACGYRRQLPLAKHGVSKGMSNQGVAVATLGGYWDSLSGAAFCGRYGVPLVLISDDFRNAIPTFIQPNASTMTHGFVFGGTAAVSADTYAKLSAVF